MKNRIFAVLLSLFVLSLGCGKETKESQLDKLRKQHDQLAEQIKKLESEIAAEGKSIGETGGKPSLVSVEPVKTNEFSHYIEVQGKLDGDENVSVSPRMGGVIKEILVKQGDMVRKDQVVALIDDALMQQGMNELKTGLAFATQIYEKQKALWDKKIGSEIQYLTAKNNKEGLEKKMATMQDQIDQCKIKSPINGSIEELPIKIGQSVAPGFPAFRVVNFSTVKVIAEVAEAYTAKVKTGDEVLVSFPDINKDVKAKVSFTSKFISPVNRTFSIEIRFGATGSEYRANMLSVVKIRDYNSPNAVAIPVSLVQSDGSGKFVFVAETTGNKSIAKKQAVKDGQSYNGTVEITEGLKAGDKLITKGFQNLEEGQELAL